MDQSPIAALVAPFRRSSSGTPMRVVREAGTRWSERDLDFLVHETRARRTYGPLCGGSTTTSTVLRVPDQSAPRAFRATRPRSRRDLSAGSAARSPVLHGRTRMRRAHRCRRSVRRASRAARCRPYWRLVHLAVPTRVPPTIEPREAQQPWLCVRVAGDNHTCRRVACSCMLTSADIPSGRLG